MSRDLTLPTGESSSPRGLATVALLKARFDEGVDQIDLFMPFVVDTVANLTSHDFIVTDVQDLLRSRHGIVIPQHTLATLLNRMVKRGYLKRESSRYKRLNKSLRVSDILAKKAAIENQQTTLASEFRSHAAARGVTIDSDDAALSMILTFLEDHQVAMLLGAPSKYVESERLTHRDSRAVAEFAQDILINRPELARILQTILEGLVVYNTAFLRDVSSTARQLTGLRVYLDTNIAFQLLGYEGPAQEALARETINLLKSVGAQSLVFEKTIKEMQSILRVHEDRMATSEGVRSLRPTPLTRYIITNRYPPSEIRQMSALIPKELGQLGIQVTPFPKRSREYTLDEKKLGELLADKNDQDADNPRVIHDVDCAAAILTIRKGAQATALADVKAVFASTSKEVIAKVQHWYDEEGEKGIGPIVHIRALSNYAWIRKPALAVNLKAHELVALCHAALQPSRKTWDRFIQHLNRLEKNNSLTTDEAVAVVVSGFTDDLLGDIEDGEIDAATLDEVVDRVRAHYEAQVQQQLKEREVELTRQLEEQEANVKKALAEKEAATLKRLDETEEAARQRLASLLSEAERIEAERVKSEAQSLIHHQPLAEEYRQLRLRVEGKATWLAHLITNIVYWFVVALVIVGAFAIIVGHPFHSGILGWVVGLGLIIFIGMELLGILEHTSHLKSRLEAIILPRIRRAVGADEPPRQQISLLGLDDTDERKGGNLST